MSKQVNKSVANKSNKSSSKKASKKNETTQASVKNDASEQKTQSKITIEASDKSDDKSSEQKQEQQTQNVNVASVKRLRRITLFSKSLTSVVKAMRMQMNIENASDCLLACNALASDKFEKSSVTTAFSDAANEKYRKKVAVLSDAEQKSIRVAIENAKKDASKSK